jgi:DNA-directed RNA polymerase subunit RPC12/RpoP
MAERLRCSKCGHRWNYKGKMRMATCPNCQVKINARNCIIKKDKKVS